MAVFIGAIAQRIAGLGFALLISPFLVILLGSHGGVLMVNVCGLVSSAMIMFRVKKDIDWSMYRWLAIPAVCGSIPASVAAVYLPAGPMAVVVGVIVLVALTVSLLMQRTPVTVTGNAPKAVAGFIAGVTNAVAGVGGPAVSAYALMARWPQRQFAATLQPFFVTIALVTLTSKLSLDASQMPPFAAWAWGLVALMIIIGIYTGEKLQRFIRDDQARAAVVILAFFGAAAALVKGIFDLAA